MRPQGNQAMEAYMPSRDKRKLIEVFKKEEGNSQAYGKQMSAETVGHREDLQQACLAKSPQPTTTT